MSALDEAQAKQGGSWGAGNPRRVALEDLTWAMLTSKEFMFNH
jgi:hypothetical protein